MRLWRCERGSFQDGARGTGPDPPARSTPLGRISNGGRNWVNRYRTSIPPPASLLPGSRPHHCRGSGFIAAGARASSLPGHGSHHCRGSGLIVAGAGGVPLSLPLPAPMTARLPDLPGYLHLVADGQRHLWDGLELRMGSGSGGGANEHRY